MKKYDVTALGELLVDMAEGPASNQGNMTFEACPGGAPCNVLSLLAKAGHKTAFIGKVGDDFLGHMLSSVIEELGIDTTGLLYDRDTKTTLAFLHKKADGDRCFSFYRKPGADMMLRPEEVNRELIINSEIFHFGTLSMTSKEVRAATKGAVMCAKENGVLVSFDPNLREPLWDTLEDAKEQMLWGIENCDILKISDNEVEFVTGRNDIEEGLEKIKAMTSASLVFVTLGSNGSIASNGAVTVKRPGVKMETIVDTTGAGDTFFGTALHYILKHGLELNENEMAELLEMANRTAAKITQVKGALKVMPEIL